MKTLTTLLALALFCATGHGQTIKSLGFNTTNGEVVANTGTNVLTFTNETVNIFSISDEGVLIWDVQNNSFYTETSFFSALAFAGTNAITAAAITRTNLGIPLPALTNTSNVTIMRELAGSTNTNEPFSNTFTIRDQNDDVFVVTVSNGIILSVQEP
jgi:hypothetical protein